MEIKQSDILIIGGGLTGLALAYMLKDSKFQVDIIESRDRLGGRIYTKYQEGIAAQEMGATWLGAKHSFLMQFLKDLDIDVFVQILGERAIYEPISTSPHQLVSLPPNNDPSYRIKGGTSTLIKKLTNAIDDSQIHTSQIVQSIENEEDNVSVKTNTQHFKAMMVVSTLPPNLLTNTIDIKPQLPADLSSIAASTHTWMGESIKISLAYAKPFWRTKNSSGTIVSNVGPIPEMYDHSTFEDNHFALKGFLNGSYFSVTKEERLAIILKQLHKYYGDQVNDFISYEELVWRKEAFTFKAYKTHVLPHQNNGHALYQKKYLDGKLWIAGAETATAFPGYMEGAIRSATFIYQQLMQNHLT